MHLHQNTFTGGLDTDTSVNKYSNSHYIKSENFRVIMGGENSSGAITTVDGNKEVISFSESADRATPVIIGLSELSGKIIVFLLRWNGTTSIYEISLGKDGSIITIPAYNSSHSTLKLRKNFGHTVNSRIRVIARRETNKLRKIYFTDSNTPIYGVNLADEKIQNYSVDRFSIMPNFRMSVPEIKSLTSGALKAGKVQYAYQLYNLYGAETMFSPVSNLMNISSSPQTGETRKHLGSDLGETTNKGVRLEISNIDNRFDRIRLVRILYEVLDAPPKIQIFKEMVVPDDPTSSINVIDAGSQTLEEMVLEEFNELLIDPIPQTIESKNNYLFVGNTTEDVFDFQFDATTKRYRNNFFTGEFEPYGNLLNPYNNLHKDGEVSSQYKWHPDGFLGGKGENIEYWFRTQRILLGSEEDFGQPYIKNISIEDGSYANAKIAAELVGYQRDEIYRFGLVGFDGKGRQSFVKWIEDIRMPDFKDPSEEFNIGAGTEIIHIWGYKNLELVFPFVAADDGPLDPDNPGGNQNILHFRIYFSKEGEFNTSKLLKINKPFNQIGNPDLEALKLEFNEHKPYGSLTLKSINLVNTPEGYRVLLSIEDQSVEGEFGIDGIMFVYPGADPTWDIDTQGGYQSSEETVYEEEIVNDYSLLHTEDGNIYANVLYIEFKVKNLPSEVRSYQIVRVERDRINRTVIDLGIVGQLKPQQSQVEFYSFPRTHEYDMDGARYILEYTSSDDLYNKLFDIQGDRLEYIYKVPDISTFCGFYIGSQTTPDTDSDKKALQYQQQTVTNYTEVSTLNNLRLKIEDSTNHSYVDNRHNISYFDGYTILNNVHVPNQENFENKNSIKDGRATKGSCKLLKVDTISSLRAHNPNGALMRRRRIIYPYGGVSLSSLANSVYIPCSKLIKDQNIVIEVTNGDAFISYFSYLRGLWTTNDASHRRRRVCAYNFPVETTINLNLVLERNFHYLGINKVGERAREPYLAMQEFAGKHPAYEEDGDIIYYDQEIDLYTYNSVYSQNNSTKKYFPKPMDFEEVTEWPNRVYYSDKKISGEFADSWLKIRPGNFVDIDTAYGELKLLKTFKDNLFFFQEKGFGVIGVEQRELIQTDSPGPLIVGLGDATTPPYYYSTDTGIQDKWHVVNSRNILYFYDGLNKKLCRIVENGVEFLSDTKNVSTLFNKDLGKIRLAFNPRYNEILISTENEGVIVFNEYLDTFTSIYTTYHDLTQLVGQELYTVGEDANRIFKDSVPGSNNWYNSENISKLTLIVNPTGNIVSVYDVLEFTLEILTQEDYKLNDFLTSVTVYNEHQETDTFSIDSDNVEQRFRTWRVNTLVDKDDESRIRSSSMFIELTYDNDGNKLILHDIITKFRTNTRYQQKSE